MNFRYILILPNIALMTACSSQAPVTSQNTAHEYLPVGAAAPTQAMLNSGDTQQHLKGFAIVTDPNTPDHDVIKSANGAIELNDRWESRDVWADIDGDFNTHAPDGFQFHEFQNCNLWFPWCGGQYDEVATGTNGNKLIRRNDYYEGSYEYVMPFSYEIQGGVYYANGFVGVPTLVADIPSGFSAEYVGEAKISAFDYGNGHADPFGTSHEAIVVAELGPNTNTVDLFIPRVDRDWLDTQFITPFKFYKVSGMEIAGNTFSGGQVLALDGNGSPVDPTGAGSEFSAQGMFYGFDENLGGPDEVAGVINDLGDAGALQIEFIAD